MPNHVVHTSKNIEVHSGTDGISNTGNQEIEEEGERKFDGSFALEVEENAQESEICSNQKKSKVESSIS